MRHLPRSWAAQAPLAGRGAFLAHVCGELCLENACFLLREPQGWSWTEISACGPCSLLLEAPELRGAGPALGRNNPSFGEWPFIVGFPTHPQLWGEISSDKQLSNQETGFHLSRNGDREVHSARPAQPRCLREVAASESLQGS